jgi:hypothetical protein
MFWSMPALGGAGNAPAPNYAEKNATVTQ